MTIFRVRLRVLKTLIFCALAWLAHGQCPDFFNEAITGNATPLCEGESITISLEGQNMPNGSSVDFYIGTTSTFNPYNGDGDFIGSVPVIQEECGNAPEILYVMVNPDNAQVGSSDDKCDEFIVLWTGSGGFNTTDIVVSNLSDGTFSWADFVAGDPTGFSCGVALPPGEVPANSILIITGAINNNVFVNSDVLCASGLPVYIIANDNTTCSGGWFDNDSPCASCPVDIDISGSVCSFSLNVNYMPPAGSTNGWGWSNMGSGVFQNVIPPLDFPVFVAPIPEIDDFVWTVSSMFCDEFGGGNYFITGILEPPPPDVCSEIFTPFFPVSVSCPELSLSGGGDVCEGNCPESPNAIIFSVLGNDVPFSVDLLITASLFPPFEIDDILVVDGQELFICLDGIFPSWDPTTNTLTIPTFAIGLSATVEIIGAESASGCPVPINQSTITLNFIAAPSSNAGSNQTICSFEQAFLNGTMGGSADHIVWSTNGDGSFADPMDPSTFYTPGTIDIQNGSVTITLTAFDENEACIPATSTLELFIEPSINIETAGPLTVCNTDVANIMAVITGPATPGMWETTGDGDFQDPNDPITTYEFGGGDISNGSVTLVFNPTEPDVCVESNEPLFIDIVNAPVVNVPQNIEVCSDDSITIHIDVTGSFIDINWFSMGDGVLIVLNDMEVNYTPGPQDIADQFAVVSVTVVSAFPECGQTTYNLPLDIVLCDCEPFETQEMDSLCFLMDTIDLSSLLIEGGAGTWSIASAPPGGNPAMIANDLFITNNSDFGTYVLDYTLTFPEPGCPPSKSTLIEVYPLMQPDLGADRQSCGGDTVVLNATFTIQIPSQYSWVALGAGSFINETATSVKYVPAPGNQALMDTIIYAIDDYGCGPLADTLIIFYNDSPHADFANDTFHICNSSDMGSVLNFFSLIMGGDAMGTWFNSGGAPVDFSNPSMVDFNGVPEGFYSFRYQTGSAVFPCVDTTYLIHIEVEECDCPLLDIQSLPGGICNSQFTLNLAAFVMAGAPGTWQILSAPPGSNPATLNGSILQTLDADPGDYRLRFTFDAAPIVGCPDSAEIDILLQETPNVSLISDTASCWLLDIGPSVIPSGSSTGVIWSTSGSGSFNDINSLNPVYSPSLNDLNAATVTLYVSSVDTLGYCTAGIDSVIIQLVHPPQTTFSALSATICNNPDSNTIINFMSLITSGDGTGFWADADGAMVDMSNPFSVDFEGIVPGSYSFTYSTNTAIPPCVDSVYVFELLVNDCACPPLQLVQIDPVICQDQTVDLESLLIIDAANGTWAIENGPTGTWPQLNGNFLSTNNATKGSYDLIYNLDQPVSGCPASDTVQLTVEEKTNIVLTTVICDQVLMVYRVFIQSNASVITTDFGDITDLGGGEFLIANIPFGQDILVEASTITQECFSSLIVDAPNCECTLITEDISDTIFLCPGDTFILIPEILGAQGLAFSTWISDVTLMRPTLPLFEAGTWIWIVKDSAGCESRDTFDVALRELITLEAFTISPTCEGMNDGSIIIEDIDGGTPPYTVQLDSGPPFLPGLFPDTLENIGVGPHIITISNLDGCETSNTLMVNAAVIGQVDLGPDASIREGDSILIVPVVTDIIPDIIQWDPASIQSGLMDFWYAPAETSLITLQVTDSLGCIYQDEVLITVLIEQLIYMPTIFSPNGDQFNDVFEVFTSEGHQPIESLEIFDRWGNMIYRQTGSGPFTWDGFSRNKEAPAGVYVVKILWKDFKGDLLSKISDLTLIR